jgi:hypothetical protein
MGVSWVLIPDAGFGYGNSTVEEANLDEGERTGRVFEGWRMEEVEWR